MISPSDQRKINFLYEKTKNLKPTLKSKLRNNRFKKFEGFKSIKSFKYTETTNISFVTLNRDEIPSLINKVADFGYPYQWITLHGYDPDGDPIAFSTSVWFYDELLKEYNSELDVLIASNHYPLKEISHYSVQGKKFD